MTPREIKSAQRIGIVASLVIAATVAAVMSLFGAPTWAWIGVGVLVYMHSFDRMDRAEGAKAEAQMHVQQAHAFAELLRRKREDEAA